MCNFNHGASEMPTTKLAKNLKVLLEKNNATPSQLSNSCGIDLPRISRMMTGKTANPNVNSLQPIAEFFDVTIDQLIGTSPLQIDASYGIVVPINRLLVPIIEWKHTPYWLEVKDHFNPKQTIDARSNTSCDAYALSINDTRFEPRFSEGSVIIVDPNLQPNNRDHIITEDKNNSQISIVQVIIENNKTFLKSVGKKFKMKEIKEKLTNFGVITELHINMLTET